MGIRLLRGLVTLTALALAGPPTLALAQAPTPPPSLSEEEARDRLIREGQAAHNAGDHNKALEAAQRAAAVRVTPSLRYFLGFEQQELGLLAEAFGNAQRCARDLELDPQHPDRDKFAGLCAMLREQLQPRIAYLTVTVHEVAPGMAVRVHGTALKEALLGVPFVITPGQAKVEAVAPDRIAYRTEVALTPGARIEVKVPPLRQAPAPALERAVASPAATVLAAPSGGTALTAKADATPDSGQRYRRWGLGLTAGGAALLVGAGATWLVGDSKFRALRDDCRGRVCGYDEAESGKSTVRLFDRVALGGAIASGALLTAGSVLYVMAAKKDDVERLDRLRLAVGLVGAGITVMAAVYGIVSAGRKGDGTSSNNSAFVLHMPAGSF